MGWEDRLEEVMATHSSILARRIPWTEEPGGLQSIGLQRVGHNLATNTEWWEGLPHGGCDPQGYIFFPITVVEDLVKML